MIDTTRFLDDIRFAMDLPLGESRDGAARRVRDVFRSVGVCTDADIVALGCTGLVLAMNKGGSSLVEVLDRARFVRGHMGGSGVGLPCYVPPTKYCLVHNTIGGLQLGQIARHQDGIDLCSRPLTPAEGAHAGAVNELVDTHGASEAKRRFGAERVALELTAPVEEPRPDKRPVDGPSIMQLRCPEHACINWRCRYCLAAAVVAGPLEPETFVEIEHDEKTSNTYATTDQLPEILALGAGQTVSAFVRVKRWTRRLVED